MLKWLFLPLLLCNLATQVQAKHQLDDIKPPAQFDNIYVKPLGSNQHASEFVIFVKNAVKPHYHQHHTELVYILSGSGVMQLNDKTIKVSTGDFIRIEPGAVHSVKVTSTHPLKALSIQTPEFKGKDRIFTE